MDETPWRCMGLTKNTKCKRNIYYKTGLLSGENNQYY